MAQNEHKKVIRQLSEVYQNVIKEERSVRYGEEDPREGRVYLSGKIEGVQKTIDVPAGASKMIDHWIKKGLQVVDKPSEEAEDVDPKVTAYKKFLRDFRRYSVAQDPVRPGEYGLTDEEVKRFKELGVQEDAEDEDFNKLENKREEARDRGREAEDKGDWDEWNRQENEREGAKDALREIEDAEDVDHLAAEVTKRTRYWMAKEGQVGQRMSPEKAFKVAIDQIQFDLGSYTIDNIEL